MYVPILRNEKQRQREGVVTAPNHTAYIWAKLGFESNLSQLQGMGVQPSGAAGFGQL